MPRALLTDAEMLDLSLAEDALNGIDVATRDRHRYAASARVLASVKKKYPTDYADDGSDAPYELKDAAAAICALSLLARRGVANEDPTYVVAKDRYDAATAWLKSLSDGEDAELVDVDPTKGSVLVATSGEPRWTRSALGGGRS